MQIANFKQDNDNKHSKEELKKPGYINYLVGFALLLFALIIGYNAFVVPDVNEIIQNEIDSLNLYFEEEALVSGEQKININNAKKEDLEKIKGIGEKLATKIIDYRETHGGFSSKKELLNINGIGEKMYNRIKDQVTI